jgi:hypothetical protein
VSTLTLGTAFSLGLRALAREIWLAAVGLLVALLRRALAWPAMAVGGLLLARGAVAAAEAHPFSREAPLAGLAFVARQPRFVLLVAGLWAAGALLGVLLRLAWVAGSLPTLAGALGPAPDPTPRFADGVAHVLPRLVPVAFLGVLLHLTGGLWALTLVLAALRISAVAAGTGPAWLAAPVALALVLAIAVPLALALLADTALVRAAVRGEGPGAALARSAERLVARPAAYLLAAFVFGAAGLATGAALQALGSATTGFLPAAPLLVLGPRLMLATLAAAVAAALELWWLASLTALATHEG